MAVTRDSLADYYQRLNDDELRRLLHSGELTALASQVAADKLRHRGVAIAADAAEEKSEEEEEKIPDVDPGDREAAAADSDARGLVLLARFASPIEAEIARGRLNAEGIFAVVADAQVVQMMAFMSHALGGVRLLVRQADLARAYGILRSI